MLRRLGFLFLALFLFYFSVTQFKQIAETGCVLTKSGYKICDRTKYAWASSSSFFGLVCIFAAMRKSRTKDGEGTA